MEQINFKEKDDFVIMSLSGSLVFYDKNIKELRAEIKEIAQKGKHLLMDFLKAEYIDSFFEGFLIYANAVFSKTGKKIVVFNANDYIRDIFRIAKIDSILTVASDYDEALKEIGG